MKLKFRTEKACFHNGRYYEADDIVECDCKFCKEGSVSYFISIDVDDKNVSQETITDEKTIEKQIDKADEEAKEIKEEKIEGKETKKKRNKIEII